MKIGFVCCPPVQANPLYRDNSRAIQKAIAKNNGLSCAADLLEQAFGVTKAKMKQIGAVACRKNEESMIESGMLDTSGH